MGLLDKLLGEAPVHEPKEDLGGILTGDEINYRVHTGQIRISDYDKVNLNPNSYNIRCGDTVTVYKGIKVIDLHDPSTYNQTETFDIPDEGIILRPGTLYLVPTREIIGTDSYVPLLTGRSSMGLAGITVHQEAGFGDVGYHGRWTMQIKVTYPTIIYKGDPIAQIYFLTPCGMITELYHGKYQGSETGHATKWRKTDGLQDA